MSLRPIIYVAALVLICLAAVGAKTGYGPGEQDWGYVDVRKGAHMFYWLYYTTADVIDYTERPLAIWLQGGPGGSSTGYGNFEELGPLTLEGTARDFTWVKDMNVLFIDNPVGTGFSYVDDERYLTSSNNAIALDLVELMKGFYNAHPEFEDVPLHIFCQSYGGKMAPEFALELYKAIQRKKIRSNLVSVVLGSPWTSPIDSVLAWGPLLLNMGIVDQAGYENIMAAANRTEELVNAGKWTQATTQWSITQRILLFESKGVDFYNIVKPTYAKSYTRKLLRTGDNQEQMYRTMEHFDIDEDRGEMLEGLMLGPVAEALQIPSNVKWGSQKGLTFDRLTGDFMKPAVHIVEELLDKTDLQVGVLSGHLDIICATAGTVKWVGNMKWSYKSEYVAAPRLGINVNRILEGYEKSVRNFSMFWINRAGHMVPAHNPAGMSHILKKYTNYG